MDAPTAVVAAGAAAAGAYVLWPRGDEATMEKVERQRTIFVSGAANGIGLETAKLFAARGWFIGCFDLDTSKLAQEFGAMVREGSACTGALDVRNADSCEHALQSFLESAPGGHLDVLFNCAGLLAIGPFGKLDLDRQLRQIDVNCTGVVNLTYKALPALKRSRGRVVTMASASSVAGIPNHAVYAATKAFVYSLTEGLRSEYGHEGVRFCDVAAPYVATGMTASQEFKGGLFDRKSAFLQVDVVAEKVWYAAHHCDFYREHFYVGTGTESLFRSVALSRFLGSRKHTDLIYKGSSLPARL